MNKAPIMFKDVPVSGSLRGDYEIHPVTRERIYYRDAKPKVTVPIEKRGMLIVTFFCAADVEMLIRRAEFMRRFGIHAKNDFLLIADGDVDEQTWAEVAQAHDGIFQITHTRRDEKSLAGSGWPQNVNASFQRAVKTLQGWYGKEKFSWLPYTCWLNFETDVIPLKRDTFDLVAKEYLALKRPFWGYVHDTIDTSGASHRHLNGAAIYPARKDAQGRWYSNKMMLARNIPWDVQGMTDTTLFSHSTNYAHCFGVTGLTKREDGHYDALQTLRNGKEEKVIVRIHANAILFHGCKDASLMNAVTPENKEIESPSLLPVLSVEDQIRNDRQEGMSYPALCKKYKKSPKALKQIIG